MIKCNVQKLPSLIFFFLAKVPIFSKKDSSFFFGVRVALVGVVGEVAILGDITTTSGVKRVNLITTETQADDSGDAADFPHRLS